jgi:hypothetical protein
LIEKTEPETTPLRRLPQQFPNWDDETVGDIARKQKSLIELHQ